MGWTGTFLTPSSTNPLIKLCWKILQEVINIACAPVVTLSVIEQLIEGRRISYYGRLELMRAIGCVMVLREARHPNLVVLCRHIASRVAVDKGARDLDKLDLVSI
jgi:hypothetical protein